MILTDKSIRKFAKEKSMIVPFAEKNLQSESYDVTIGREIIIMKKEIRCLDISDQSMIDDIYEKVDIEKEGFVISPKQYVLVSLGETIRMPSNITAHLRAKTTYTRLGLIVSDQHCNSTYSGHLRIGLFNATDYPVRIHAGYPIAQIVFEELDGIPSDEKLYRNKKNAHYQNENGEFRGAKFDDKLLNDIWDKILE